MVLEFYVLVALVVAIVEVFKRVLKIEKDKPESDYVPVLAVVLGIVFNCVASWGLNGDLIIVGLMAGLTACGLWDVGIKSIGTLVFKAR